jgi:hypothetical protein
MTDTQRAKALRSLFYLEDRARLLRALVDAGEYEAAARLFTGAFLAQAQEAQVCLHAFVDADGKPIRLGRGEEPAERAA